MAADGGLWTIGLGEMGRAHSLHQESLVEWFRDFNSLVMRGHGVGHRVVIG